MGCGQASLVVRQGKGGRAREVFSIKITTIYAKVTKEDKARAADALAKAYRDSQRNRGTGASWPRHRRLTLHNPSESGASS